MKETRRYPELGCSVIQLAVQRSPIKTPEGITDEAMRIMDERDRRARDAWREVIKGDLLAILIIVASIVVLWVIGG